MPHFSLSVPLEKPLNARSTINALMPDGSFSFFLFWSDQAKTRNWSATSASEIHIFSPLRIQRSPF